MMVPHDEDAGEALLGGDRRGHLVREALPAFLLRQRWFAGKALALESVRLVDHTPPGACCGETFLVLIEAIAPGGKADLYFLPLGVAAGPVAERLLREAPGRVIVHWPEADGTGILYDALADPAACEEILATIEEGRSIATASGRIRGIPTGAYSAARGPAEIPLPVVYGTVEQSNSAVLYGDRLILKVFRRIEPGLNPDFEIGRFLSERTDFDRIPQAAGAIVYERPGAEPATLGILQGLVQNQGTGWDHALRELRGYYEEVGRRPAGMIPIQGGSLLEAASGEPPPVATETMGGYLKAAATLGRRTAELHLALASDERDPDFAPEPLSGADVAAMEGEIREQVEKTIAALRINLDRLPDAIGAQARRAIGAAGGLLRRLDELRGSSFQAAKIRCHGDYHLGQVLRTEDDFVILDFEGEPARPLAWRRRKQSPLKDVVGMLRSFDYAAFAALFKCAEDRPDDLERLVPWARAWQTWTSAAFLRAYLATVAGASLLPDDPAGFAALLRAFTLDKALYELLYELNNRPAWVRIPLQGVLALIEDERSGDPTRPDSDPACI